MFKRACRSNAIESRETHVNILMVCSFVGHQSSSYRDAADRFGITLSAWFDIITRVANFLISVAPTVIKYPKHQYLLGRIGVLGSLEFFHLFQKNPYSHCAFADVYYILYT